MTIPKNWQPGDPITAAQLNTGNVEASRPRRAISLGSGSSLVNETLGNQSVSAKVPLIRLVVAMEDFAIQEEPTDLNGVIDDVPSGLVKEIRLNRKSGTHVRNESQNPFRAYDVTAGLTGFFCEAGSDSASTSASASSSSSQSTSESGSTTSGKLACDVFYVFFNQDSKRWEVMDAGSGGSDFMWFTIIEAHCPDSYDPDTYLIVEPLYVPGGCTKTPPGGVGDGTYKFYELCSDDFDGQVASELAGTIGNGHYVFPWQSEACEPKWIINLLCNIPEC